jgi:diguanylate cyclase (GGDEF)-like protein
MQIEDALVFLGHVDIFSLLSPSERRVLLDTMNFVEFQKGHIIFKEGDRGDTLYIVKSGTVSISLRLSNGQERELVEFSAGDFFGEMSIFENAPRSASCTTKEDSALFTLSGDTFFQFVESHPFIAIKIMYRMLNSTSQRLRNTDEFLSDMVQWGEKARKRAVTDELTGVYNRRFLDEALEEYFISSKAEMQSLSIVMVDLDNFRDINELYSTEVGDAVIVSVVEVFRKKLRAQDVIARYGGDEFTILLPDTGSKEARRLAEDICVCIEQLDVLERLKGPIARVTTSQGIATYPEHAENLKSLREKADQALYRAKHEGRNRVVTADSNVSF